MIVLGAGEESRDCKESIWTLSSFLAWRHTELCDIALTLWRQVEWLTPFFYCCVLHYHKFTNFLVSHVSKNLTGLLVEPWGRICRERREEAVAVLSVGLGCSAVEVSLGGGTQLLGVRQAVNHWGPGETLGLWLQVLGLHHTALQLSSHMMKTVSPTQHRRPTMSEYSGPSAWFSKHMHWGWRLQRPTVDEWGLCKHQRPHRSLVLSNVFTALVSNDTIRSDNYNPRDGEYAILKAWTWVSEHTYLWRGNVHSLIAVDRVKLRIAGLSLIHVLVDTGP